MRGLLRFRRLLGLATAALTALLFALPASGLLTSPTAQAAAHRQARPPSTRSLQAKLHAARTKLIRYHRYRLVVPAAWPVYDLAAHPTVCVRFNRHAVYLGRPSARQRCPAHAAGRTEAILVAPLAAHGAAARGNSGEALPPVRDRNAQPTRGSSTQLAVPGKGVLVTATWSGDPAVVARALGVRSLHQTTAARSATPPRAAPRAPLAHPSSARPHVTHRAGDPLYTGLGFDACSTPSPAAMAAWGASPYRAVGIYIGGANEACSQPNLNATWVGQESAAGWVLLPIYVGLQAPHNGCGCAAIVPAQAAAEGTVAAGDAVAQAEAVGIGPGNPIYDDMEAYSRTITGNTSAVLAFLSAWTTELHARGYLSGVYSSAQSGVTDLVRQYGSGYIEPDQIWNAEWNGQATTVSAYLPSTEWANHQRLHQYQGGHNATYGGVTINIDSDYVDAGAAAGNLFPNGTFVQVSGQPQFYEIAGGAPLYVSDWSAVGGQQPYTVISQQQFDALNPVPADGTLFETDTGAIYVVAGGAPMYVTSTLVFAGDPQPFLVDEWNLENVGNPLSHLNARPNNGTFISTTTGKNYRIAGGAPIGISTWKVFGGVKSSVMIDPWDVENIFNPLAHLAYRPALNTVVQGLPSGAYWRFGPKNRYLVPPTAGAVRVDDHGLRPFSATRCRIPNLIHKTLAQAKTAALKADCHLRKVTTHRVSRRRHVLRVIRQSVRARTMHPGYYPIGITIG